MTKFLKPEARRNGIVTQEMSDELLVYDLESNKAHCLNSTASFVWRNCDGENTVDDIRAEFEQKTGQTVSEEIIVLAFEQLHSTELILSSGNVPASGISRRELLKKAGFAAAVALPLVSSLAVPSNVFASLSGSPSGSPCTSPVECSSGVCVPGTPPFCA